MKAMARALRSALDAHEAIEVGDLRDIVMVSPDATFDDLLILAEQLRKWTPLFEELAQRSLPRGLEENDRLLRCCERLRIFYEAAATVNKATHASLDDLDETRLPQTAFGTFVRAFFRYVDPDAEPLLNEALRKAISEMMGEGEWSEKAQPVRGTGEHVNAQAWRLLPPPMAQGAHRHRRGNLGHPGD